MNFSYLTFSDGAKFALIGRNLINGNGFNTDFSFWGDNLFATGGIPLLVPHIIAIFFRIFGINDKAVIAFSLIFFILLVIATYLLASKLFSSLVGIFSAAVVAFNKDFIGYATSGASETLFAFETVISVYLLTFKNFILNIIGFLFLILMYFTRPQAFIFMAGILFYWLINRYGVKKGLIYFTCTSIVGIIIDKFIIYPLSFKYPLTPVFARGIQSILTYSSNAPVSDALRGAASSTLGTSDVFKKLFYNIYNFYKLLPQIINPYLFTLFLIGLTKKEKKEFKIFTLVIVISIFTVTALTIPFFRYIHPVIPFVYILGVASLSHLIPDKKVFASLVILFGIGQGIGLLVLDSRFERNTKNISMPPVYVTIAQKLKSDTEPEDLIVTNLDTWGSWYGERKTIWFPLTTKMLSTSKANIKYIYLTSYKIDDENYYMGESWREIFNDPMNQTILPEYKLLKEYKIEAVENYENETARAILLVKNE